MVFDKKSLICYNLSNSLQERAHIMKHTGAKGATDILHKIETIEKEVMDLKLKEEQGHMTLLSVIWRCGSL